MGGVKSNIGGLRQGDRLAARWEEPGAVMTANGSQEVSLCYVKKYFGVGKGAALEIWQAWQGWGRHGSSGVRVQYREILSLICWYGYR